jgi:hypothetical protein
MDWWALLVRIDKYLNFLTGGERGQTLSARAGLASFNGNRMACKMCKVLDRFDEDHCLKEVIKWLKL